MEDTPTQTELSMHNRPKKACQISLMFPVEDDKEAFGIKQAIDIIVGDIKDKRYTFNITEM